MKKNLKEQGQIDWMITLVPLGIVIALCVLFLVIKIHRIIFIVYIQSQKISMVCLFLQKTIHSIERGEDHCRLQKSSVNGCAPTGFKRDGARRCWRKKRSFIIPISVS